MEMLSQKGLDRTEKSYFYDKDGRIARRVMQSGDEHQEIIASYKEHGDEAGTVQIESCFDHLPDDPKLAHLDKCRSEVRYLYEYDNHDNWTEQTVDGSSSVTRRQDYVLLSATGLYAIRRSDASFVTASFVFAWG